MKLPKNLQVYEHMGRYQVVVTVNGDDYYALGNNQKQAMRNLVRELEREMSKAQKLADTLDKVADRIWNKI